MSVRRFSVFMDSPEEDQSIIPGTAVSTSKPHASTSSSTTATSPSSTCSAIIDSILSPSCEKENIHPITGSAASAQQQASKKRKVSGSTNVLATKSVAPQSTGSSASLGKGKRPEVKRRSSSVSSVSSTKSSKGKESSRGKGDKPRKVLGSSENKNRSRSSPSPSRTPSRSVSTGGLISRAPTLDAIPEHLDSEAIKQALIDAKCYELTVLPLADVSSAYLPTAEEEKKERSVPPTPEREVSIVKEQASFEHQIRDYFLSSSSYSLSTATSSSSISSYTPSIASQEQGFRIYRDGEDSDDDVAGPPNDGISKDEEDKDSKPLLPSTPQRKQMYAAFTFSSPLASPTKSK